MPEAYIVDAVRTPVGRRGGGLAGAAPRRHGRARDPAVVERTGIDPAAIDDVIIGCLDNIGAQAGNIARTAALAAGLPETVPGVTIDRQCGSSQQAVHFAAQAVMSGTSDLVIAGGIQNMSQYPDPLRVRRPASPTAPPTRGPAARVGGALRHRGCSASSPAPSGSRSAGGSAARRWKRSR